jgi:endonuclease/exonuclease/phosphatase family metal-dependent hydrolase
VRVLIWNLYHGRAAPPAGRPLAREFAATIAGWDWDVALLQECPPWWPPRLAEAARAQARWARTSRNALLPLRRAIASRAPDLLKSNGGGCNAILVRGEAILEHRVVELTRRPERRVAHGVRLASGWVVNLHATLRPKARTHADVTAAAAAWADAAPLVLGGDFNLRRVELPGFEPAAAHRVDHVLVRGGWRAAAPGRTLDAGPLSDHRPVLATLALGADAQR